MSSNLSSKAKAEFPRRSSRGAHVQCTPRRESTGVPDLRELIDCSTNWSVTRLFCCVSAAHGHEAHQKPKIVAYIASIRCQCRGVCCIVFDPKTLWRIAIKSLSL